MDILTRDRLQKLIKQITETGEWSLEASLLKSIKSICKKSDDNVEAAFELVMSQLKKEHAQIRYSSLQLIEQLFQRSHKFRALLVDDFPLFISLVIGVRQQTLPPPTQVAAKLKQYALALVKDWNVKFGDKYRPIAIGYNYLDDNGLLAQGNSTLETIHTWNREASDKRRRMQPVYARRFEQIKKEMQEHLDLIKENLEKMESCFEILVPKNDSDGGHHDFEALLRGDTEMSSTLQDGTYKEQIMAHGLASNRYKITIDLSDNPIQDQVHESKENEILYQELREGYKVLESKHSKQINEWINSLSRIDHVDNHKKEKLLKQLIDIKAEINEVTRKAKLLNIQYAPREDEEQDDEDDALEELFEEIDIPTTEAGESSSAGAQKKHDDIKSKESTITISSSKLPPAQRIFPLSFEPEMKEDVTYNANILRRAVGDNPMSSTQKGKEKQDTSREALLKVAPKVEWDDDLYYWDKSSVQFNTSGIERAHRFMGVGEGTNEMPGHLLESLRKRTIYYKEKPKQLEACKAPLHNGKLCPRRDLVTCPFHGRIIPRDDLGRPINPEANKPDSSGESQRSTSPVTSIPRKTQRDSMTNDNSNLWEQIEEEVMAQSGQKRIELNRHKRKKSNKKTSGLIDLRQKKENSYTRLQKKLDDPSVKRQVIEAAEYEQSIKSRNLKMNTWTS